VWSSQGRTRARESRRRRTAPRSIWRLSASGSRHQREDQKRRWPLEEVATDEIAHDGGAKNPGARSGSTCSNRRSDGGSARWRRPQPDTVAVATGLAAPGSRRRSAPPPPGRPAGSGPWERAPVTLFEFARRWKRSRRRLSGIDRQFDNGHREGSGPSKPHPTEDAGSGLTMPPQPVGGASRDVEPV
jgi:hypothetical protein